ncbi:Clp protease [Actinomadura soli]|uniref:Clp protease n=1 Tax=Actinomadura soli TaxID=2508997 RepID=A0A5C4JIB6_9ACTN|nr:Clp protease N-terminal domain-containing protein [Actinomadura soli]TMR06421.1 Clp protease [Actinomadura soli]
MSQEFGTYVKAVMERAADEAQRAGAAAIEAEHLLLAMAAEPESTTRRLLDSAGLDHRAIRDALDEEFRRSLSAAGVIVDDRELPPPSRSPRRPSRIGASGKLVLERGVAAVAHKKDLRPAHLLLGVLRLNAGTVPRALALAGVDRNDLTARVRRSLPGEAGQR